MRKNVFRKMFYASIILGISSVPSVIGFANEVSTISSTNETTETMELSEEKTFINESESEEILDSTVVSTMIEEVQSSVSEVEEEIEITFFDDLNLYPHNRSDIELDQNVAKGYSSSRAVTPNVSITDTNTPTKGFIDISSHNGSISVNDFKKMKSYGVTGVVVKLTEATTYTNPFASEQVKNAQAAGLKVSAYHYSWFTDDASARREADHFVKVAKNVGLPLNTVMVNDIEEPKITGKADHTKTSLAFQKRLNELGYINVTHYMGAHWLNSGLIDPAALGYKNIWVAAYPYQLSTTQQYSEYGAWQWSSKLSFSGINGSFDISSDYSNRYTLENTEKPLYQGTPQPLWGLWYRSHVADLGWLGFVGTEVTSGTTGQNRRLEAIDVMWNKEKKSIRSSFQDINGRWVETGTGITGTVGQALPIQRVCFASNDDLLKTGRKIQYRVHSQDVGWSAWKEEGQPAGSSGKKIESIEMRIIKNGVVEKG